MRAMTEHSADPKRIKRWRNPRIWSGLTVLISMRDAPAGGSAN